MSAYSKIEKNELDIYFKPQGSRGHCSGGEERIKYLE